MKEIFKFFLPLLKPYKWWYLCMIQGPVAHSLYPVLYNYSIKIIIDALTLGQAVHYGVFLFITCNIINEVCWRVHNLGAWKIYPHLWEKIIFKIFARVQTYSYKFFTDTSSGVIMSKIKGILDGFANFQRNVEFSLAAPLFTFIFTGLALGFVNFYIFIVAMVFTTCLGIVSFYFNKNLLLYTANQEEARHKILGLISDSIGNIFSVFAFASKKREMEKVINYYNNYEKPERLKWHKVDFLYCCLGMLCIWLFMIFLIFYVLNLHSKGLIAAGSIAFLTSTSYIFVYNSWSLITAVSFFMKEMASFKTSFEVMLIEPDKLDKKTAIELKI